MAPRKKPLVATTDEIEEAGIKTDFFADRRDSSGYIRLTFNEYGANRMAQAAERRIEERQAELDKLRSQQKKFEKLEDKLEEKAKVETKKKSKKDKKREKKEKKRLKNLPESSRILFSAIEEYTDKHHKSKKQKKKEKQEFEGVSDKASRKAGTPPKEKTPEQEEAEKKRKEAKERNEFEMKFDEPITLHRQTVIEVDKTLQEIGMMLEEAKNSRARNRNVVIKDLLSAKGSLLGNRIQSANGIASIQKTKLDAAEKQIKAKAGENNEKNQNINLLAKAFPQLVSGGLASASVGAAGGGGKSKGKDKDRDRDYDSKEDKGKGGKKKEKRRSQDDDDDFMATATRLIKSGDVNLTPHEAAIGIEGKYKVAIKKNFKTQDWIFIAIDNNENEIANFKQKHPGVLPRRKDHNMKFDDEKSVARCSRTDQLFQVIQVPYF